MSDQAPASGSRSEAREAPERANPGEAHEATPTGLNALARAINDTAVGKGWWGGFSISEGQWMPDRNFPEVLALIHSEVSEALEAYRDGLGINKMYYKHPDGTVCREDALCPLSTSEETKPEGIPSEMADILIRVLDACGAYGIDIESAVRSKMEYNRTRPERHGGKRA